MSESYYVPSRCKRVTTDELDSMKSLHKHGFKRRYVNISCVFHQDAFKCLAINGETYKCSWCKKGGPTTYLIGLIEEHAE